MFEKTFMFAYANKHQKEGSTYVERCMRNKINSY